jgi:uncharacterized membrane protein YeaQ/YmgE (transglycosylase-associated protein family)
MLHWIWVILIGLVIGAIAKLVMPGKDPGGIIVTMLLGIAGSIVATWLGRVVGLYQEGQSAGFLPFGLLTSGAAGARTYWAIPSKTNTQCLFLWCDLAQTCG